MSTASALPIASNSSPGSSGAIQLPSLARRRAVVLATVLENQWIPERIKPGPDGKGLTSKQAEFLGDERREILYGGAAGGGKSVALLAAAAQYVTESRYSALILRRTFRQLAKSDSILSLAKDWWLSNRDVRYNGDLYTFTFPSGAVIEFGHMDTENAKHNYQGGGYRFVGYDELTQFTDTMYLYLFSRQRRDATSQIPLRMRATSNPGGIGHEWVKSRFIDPQTRHPSARFIPARLSDNPNIDRESYLESLSYLDPLTRDQLEKGDWDAVAGGRFQKAWFGWYRKDSPAVEFVSLNRNGQEIERFLWKNCARFQTCDPAASTSTAADYFVLSTWLVTPRANVLWWGCEREKLELPEQVELCQRSYRINGPKFVAVEEVLNQRGLAQLLRRSKNPLMVVHGVSPLGRDKLARAAGFINLVHDGRVFLPEDNRAFPLDDVIGELTRFTGDPDQDAHDDIVDSGSYMAELLPSMGGGQSSAPTVWKPRG
jgi:phage terminase large subunit-like protein